MAKTGKTSEQEVSRSGVGAPVAVARSVRAVTSKALGKVGHSFAQLVSNWSQVVGPDLAQKCLPASLTFPKGKNANATLHIAVHSHHALELSHGIPLLMERVNSFLGYQAIATIKLDHKHITAPHGIWVTGSFRGGAGHVHSFHQPVAHAETPLSPEVCQISADIQDPELRARVESLCRAVARAA